MAFDLLDSAPGQDKWIDAFPKINVAIEAADNATFSGVLATKIVQIGDWDMDTIDSVSINIGISDFLKIRSVNVIIRSDTNDSVVAFPYFDPAISELAQLWFQIRVGIPDVKLIRRTGGTFDSVNFDSTSFNRGWITITYEV